MRVIYYRIKVGARAKRCLASSCSIVLANQRDFVDRLAPAQQSYLISVTLIAYAALVLHLRYYVFAELDDSDTDLLSENIVRRR